MIFFRFFRILSTTIPENLIILTEKNFCCAFGICNGFSVFSSLRPRLCRHLHWRGQLLLQGEERGQVQSQRVRRSSTMIALYTYSGQHTSVGFSSRTSHPMYLLPGSKPCPMQWWELERKAPLTRMWLSCLAATWTGQATRIMSVGTKRQTPTAMLRFKI